MRVHYDWAIGSIQKHGGVTRYYNDIIEQGVDVIDPIIGLHRSVSAPAWMDDSTKIVSFNPWRWRPGRICRKIEPFVHSRSVREQLIDVYHPTYYHSCWNSLLPRWMRPLVVTVHDLTHYLYPSFFEDIDSHKRFFEHAIHLADVLIAVSENTKSDLIQYFPQTASKVAVIHHGVPSPCQQTRLAFAEKSRQQFVYVGSRAPYKGFSLLLKAAAEAASVIPHLRLIVIGVLPSEVESRMVADLGLEETVDFVGPLNEFGLADVFLASLALVYPSSYEGFGYPILEAQRLGLPVICHSNSSISEVVAGSACMAECYSEDDFANAMIELYRYPALQRSLATLGLQNVRRFTLDRFFKRTLSVYRSAV